MKNILFTLIIVASATMGFSQIKVITNGNVGIGNGSPLGGIHAINNNSGQHFRFWADTDVTNGNHNIANFFRKAPGNGNAGMALGYNADGNDVSYSYLFAPGARDFALATFDGGFSLPFYIQSNGGRIGIGTTSPNAKLDVQGSAFKTAGGDLWNVVSDKRLKNEIKPYEKGLKEVMKLNPVSWYYNGKAGTNTEDINVGLIAQEYQKIEPDFVTEYVFQEETIISSDIVDDIDDAHMVKGPKETYLSLNATPIRYMLINAIQEQQSIIEDMQSQLAELKDQISNINSINSSSPNEIDITLEGVYNAELAQNVPNPFDINTSIEYSIPNNIQADAEILIYNINGKLMKKVAVDHVGKGILNVNTLELESGNYTYSLLLDGRVIDTKKMIVTK